MATVTREITIAADPARAWEVLGDYVGAPVRMAPGFITDSRPDGPDVRVVSFAGGAVLRERLISLDHDERRVAFSVVGDTAVPEHDNAAVQVLPHADGGTRIVWTRDVLPAELAAEWGPGMAHVLELFKETLE